MKQGTEHRGWLSAILHRWPTWFAIALAALTAGVPGSVGGLSEALLLLGGTHDSG